MMNSFWWGQKKDGSPCLKWKSWDKLCHQKVYGGLGFRRVHEFNMALLANQAWRLLAKPDSLCGRIYKARYYAQSDFLEAKMGYNPSFIWRSIMSCQPLIKAGARRRVGNGCETQIWGMPWLCNEADAFVHTAAPKEAEKVTVDALFIPGQLKWDASLIDDLFLERDREAIKVVPLPREPRPDVWSWAFHSKGIYTVKTGYEFLRSYSQSAMGLSVTNWNYIWALNVPPKIRNFLWRMLLGCLPTRSALHSRHVDLEDCCPRCISMTESDLHVLINCPVLSLIWSKAEVNIAGIVADNIVQWWNYLASRFSKSQVEHVAAILWTNWNSRNDLLWSNKSNSAQSLLHKSGLVLAEWRSANEVIIPFNAASIDSAAGGSHGSNKKWEVPLSNIVKCNIDAALFSDPFKMGFGGVIRDVAGGFVAACQGSINGRFSPLLAEAIGLREVLSWLKNKSIDNCIIELDSQLVVHAINCLVEDVSSVGLIIDDCKALMEAIANSSVIFVYRSANAVAHFIARATRSMSGLKEWDMSSLYIIN